MAGVVWSVCSACVAFLIFFCHTNCTKAVLCISVSLMLRGRVCVCVCVSARRACRACVRVHLGVGADALLVDGVVSVTQQHVGEARLQQVHGEEGRLLDDLKHNKPLGARCPQGRDQCWG